MWYVKEFKTREAMEKFLAKKAGLIDYTEIFIDGCEYAIEYKYLRVIDIDPELPYSNAELSAMNGNG